MIQNSSSLPSTCFKLSNVPTINQYEIGLPTGCEATALAQALHYFGLHVSPVQIATMLKKEPFMFQLTKNTSEDHHKNLDDATTSSSSSGGGGGETLVYGGNPKRAFVGNPFSALEGMGVYDEPLIELVNCFFIPILNKLNTLSKKVKGVKRFSSSSLTHKTIDFESILEYMYTHQVPVVIWCTLKMRESFHNSHETWFDYLNKDHVIQWKSPEHCVTLIGFDIDINSSSSSSTNEQVVIVNDPDCGCEMRYNRKLFEQRFMEMGGMAFSFETCEP
ncbi:hypothetical protein C9374_008647 [Naegleria lovaniensis]|uniref:Peptidase C39-like domain-containing protein n=1 Tax=Naegleria lovaniensis TaxID=51637 RepID=A0AA88KFR9_NAELO|nr:uncharacterized protein C9374_008647 [Naegleria lovaniensis]KAG2378025.1 hypothetical protein C9374_008647 [Naegleria lovaniensis]